MRHEMTVQEREKLQLLRPILVNLCLEKGMEEIEKGVDRYGVDFNDGSGIVDFTRNPKGERYFFDGFEKDYKLADSIPELVQYKHERDDVLARNGIDPGVVHGLKPRLENDDINGNDGVAVAPQQAAPVPGKLVRNAVMSTQDKDKNVFEEIMKKLQAPFKPEEIEWRVGSTSPDKSRGLALAYVTNRAIQNRLDELFGPFDWKNEFREWKDKSQLCGISIRDPESGEWVTKWDGADDSNMEAVKGGLSDAMKRCAYQWGIGRYLYDLEAVWCKLDGNKRLTETPQLPSWALPEGYKADKPEVRQEPKPEPKPEVKPESQPEPKPEPKPSSGNNCSKCGSLVSDKVAKYSMDKLGKVLCFNCQKLERGQ